MSKHGHKAMDIVNYHWKLGAGAGLLPIPVLDFAAVAGVQVKMVRELAHLYNIPFESSRAKALIGALLGSYVGFSFIKPVGGIASTLTQWLPYFNPLIAVTVKPAMAGAATYAVGKVFVQHFEAGGTLLDFEPDKVRDHFKKEFEAAKEKKAAEATEKAAEPSAA